MTASSVPAAILVTLPLYDFLAVEGTRAIEFLQGQLSCDLREAHARRVLPGAWCSVKGRVIANFLLWAATPERVILRLRADLAEDTATALRRYAALSRVTVRRAEPALACFGMLGSALRPRLQEVCGTLPEASHGLCVTNSGVAIVQRDATGTLLEAWVPGETAAAWADSLGAVCATGAEADWRLALVERRLAEIQAATRDLFLPQMLGFDSDGTVSFRKGCYTGQEVIARTHYKGNVKRHLVLLRGNANTCPAPGAELMLAGHAAGTVLDAGVDPGAGRVSVLAVLHVDAASTGPISTRTGPGAELQLSPADPML